MGHYVGHYNDQAKVSIFILGCGYPGLYAIVFSLNFALMLYLAKTKRLHLSRLGVAISKCSFLDQFPCLAVLTGWEYREVIIMQQQGNRNRGLTQDICRTIIFVFHRLH